MNNKEFAIIASAIKTYYPKEKILINDQAMALWYEQLQDIPFNVAEAMIKSWVAMEKWAPTIADIREKCAEITGGAFAPWGEAWEEVLSAIRWHGLYDIPGGLESMSELTRRVVNRIGFENICKSENIVADRSNFRMIYETELKRAKTDMQMPPRVKEMIAKAMPQITERGNE